ncbi:hypothetical protein [Catellatospora sp. NPDC049133]|uniref:hypothetical protein n=1 Tax=Catellatospora sp. NPDC049133 TaxID=3155499 RepID=UPI0033C4933B
MTPTTPAPVELVTVRMGEAAYEELLGPVRADAALLEQMWRDAETPRLDEKPGKTWCVATVHHGGRRIAAAWAAAIEEEHEGQRILRCSDSYDVPAWRGRSLYTLAYAWRHATIVVPTGLPARTFVYAQPKVLHDRDGWTVVNSDTSHEPGLDPHEWFEMWWYPPQPAAH